MQSRQHIQMHLPRISGVFYLKIIIVILTTCANEIKYSQKDTKETDMIYRLHDSNGIQDGKREED